MKMYELPVGTIVSIIDHDMLMNIDYRQWRTWATKKNSYFETHDFIDYVSVQNNRDDTFPAILKNMIVRSPQTVIVRAYNNGITFYAKCFINDLNYLG